MLKTAFLNLLLRLLSSGSRLVLVVGLARFLPVEDVGRFGLVLVSVQMLVYAAGLEFHLFATRSLLAQDESGWPVLLRGQVAIHAIAYAFLLPASGLLFLSGWLEPSLAIWFYPLLIAEHACQELQRVLVTRGRPLQSNCVFFARTGAWGLAIIVAMVLWPTARDLRWVWAGWLGGAIVGAGIGVAGLSDLNWYGSMRTPLNRAWIRDGITVSMPYLLGNLALLGITTVDRYLLAALANASAVGVYVFFFGISNAMLTLTESGVVNVVIPDVIRAGRRGDVQATRRLIRGVLTMVPSISLAIVLFIRPLLMFVKRDLYVHNLAVCWVLLAAVAVSTVGLIPHTLLYANGRDRSIISADISGLLAAICAHLVLIPLFGAIGAAFATLIAMLVVSGLKALAIARS